MFLPALYFKESNLFLIESIFKWPKYIFSGERFLISFTLIFASMIKLQQPYSRESHRCFPESLRTLKV